MIDLNQLRDNADYVIAAVLKKDPAYNIHELIRLDELVRSMRVQAESLRHRKNVIAQAAKNGITQEMREESKAISAQLKDIENNLQVFEKQFNQLYLECPNLPFEDVPAGGKESNEVVRSWGTQPAFAFTPKNHLDLGNALGWFNFEAAARMTAANFALYQADAVKLLYSLTMFMMKHNMQRGYTPILPPYIVNEKSLEVASNFPKFRDQVYAISEDKLFLSPTAEVNLANLYREHIFQESDFPIRHTAWTSCFRREAGGYGAAERGLIRIHQFEKVELFTLCTPEQSAHELERMVESAESILKELGLTYRVSLLAGQDCSFASAKTYDIEVWLPGQNEYKEVSSCSNCTDFQARRGMIRFKHNVSSKTQLAYTLNGSSLAVPRLMVAIMEQFQQEDGSIAIPECLKKFGIW